MPLRTSCDPNGYMQYEAIQDYYTRLTNSSPEDMVGHMWTNTLGNYFPTREDFGLEVQPRAVSGSNDTTIRYVKKYGRKTPLVLIADKGVLKEDPRSAKIWREARDELADYMTLARRRNADGDALIEEAMFGIVAIAQYSKFFVMKPHESTLTELPDTEGDEPLEFKRHEAKIVKFLLNIKADAAAPPPPSDAGSLKND